MRTFDLLEVNLVASLPLSYPLVLPLALSPSPSPSVLTAPWRSALRVAFALALRRRGLDALSSGPHLCAGELRDCC